MALVVIDNTDHLNAKYKTVLVAHLRTKLRAVEIRIVDNLRDLLSVEDIKGIVLTGSDLRVTSKGDMSRPCIIASLYAIRKLGRRVPVLGICLGMQLLVTALEPRVRLKSFETTKHLTRKKIDWSDGEQGRLPACVHLKFNDFVTAEQAVEFSRLRCVGTARIQDSDGAVYRVCMAVVDASNPKLAGVQFHPELNASGKRMLDDWLSRVFCVDRH